MKKQAIYQPSIKKTSLRQGEILTDVIQYNPVVSELSIEAEELSFQAVIHPYAIVVTQDCDLDWDYRARQTINSQPSKLLNSIILCEIATAREVREIADKNVMNSGEWNLVKSQRHERFYFFERIPLECELQQIGLPELTADFKKVFGINAATLYRQIELGIAKRRAVLSSPYLEHFSRRYYSFHGRVALPDQYKSEREG
ncbi:MAG TPA: hypothetical protein DEG17_21140 [Cyanobacteria bacterium UBA11149]|nr:hypothetical protein [Cyanobacteria bacterium UBA11367]HBE57989.1 hypothetical protein [Cyanobacteria bacterium UBA11366]HBK62463.1 hypothetical protein [Cyanobacteria bacterium UBA11166]HBR74000.1 hypothetical protein [Cyanobacteria bacterium UBA11159]HBS72099.1 hypothetical protein [Cyanobacteria bacterium UBA11153]HBW91296.1 hypothetical protein [Cyanobacteria bacterium UBA11149]HCA96248.1 hypothetical protein [Cyanobacteria bacterium UBA9226]